MLTLDLGTPTLQLFRCEPFVLATTKPTEPVIFCQPGYPTFPYVLRLVVQVLYSYPPFEELDR